MDLPREISAVHQCPHCFTVYDPEYGDILRNIPAGTIFQNLPETYTCPTCDADKNEMEEVVLTRPTLTTKHWIEMDMLQRFALVKLSRSGHEGRNFPIAFKEFFGR